MEITCRCEDQDRFQALGFTAQGSTSPFVEMVDEQANYAHYGNLPADIPYHGHFGAGSEYGPGKVACDGKVRAEVDTGLSGGFVVDWDEKKNRPSLRSLKAIRSYLKTRKTVENLFTQTT